MDNRILEERLTLIANCYIKQDFKDLYPYLSNDVAWESNWVMEPRKGYEVVTKYYDDKAIQLKNSGWKTYHTLVKTLDSYDNPNKSNVILAHEVGKLMDYVTQVSNKGVKSDMIIDIKVNDDNGLITRIDICMPSLFNYEKYREINKENK